MIHALDSLPERELFWKYFIELAQVPRPSKHEQQAREWVLDYVRAWNYKYNIDDAGNLVVLVPASATEYSTYKTIAIQSHLDMVCEKDASSPHDFFHDPLQLRILEDENDTHHTWLSATGTTLGADNGIAMAYQMAIMDPNASVPHGHLEMIFTVDEETGLNGAAALSADMMTAEYMINIDNFREGMCSVGCAGGEDFIAEIPIQRSKIDCEHYIAHTIIIEGLAGGHSGSDIYDGRANALKLMEMILTDVIHAKDIDIQIVSIDGGDKINAIVREAVSKVYIHQDDIAKAKKRFQELERFIRNSSVVADEEFSLCIEDGFVDMYEPFSELVDPMDNKTFELLARLIRCCPYGVQIRNSLESTGSKLSNNLSSIRTYMHNLRIVCNLRFANNLFYRAMRRNLLSVFDVPKIKVKFDNYYDAWEQKSDSRLSPLFMDTYKQLSARNAVLNTLHVGIECGVINSRVPQDIDAICIGPQIEGAHSPFERINIPSAELVWQVLIAMLTHEI